MKTLISIVFCAAFLLSCKNNSSSTTQYDAISSINPQNLDMQLSIDTVLYEATTRGFYEKIIIVENKASYINERSGFNNNFQKYDNDQWHHLIEEIKKIGPSNLENFKAPSKMHEYDGAALAYIEVYADKNTYRTQTFDRGNPPKELALLDKTIQSIKDSIVKQ